MSTSDLSSINFGVDAHLLPSCAVHLPAARYQRYIDVIAFEYIYMNPMDVVMVNMELQKVVKL